MLLPEHKDAQHLTKKNPVQEQGKKMKIIGFFHTNPYHKLHERPRQ